MDLARLSKKMAYMTGLAGGFCALASAVYYRSAACLPFVIGVILGTALSVLKIFMLRSTVDKAVLMSDASRASNYLYLQHLIRFLLTAIVLVAAALTPFISLWGAVTGVLLFQAAIWCIGILTKKQERSGAVHASRKTDAADTANAADRG